MIIKCSSRYLFINFINFKEGLTCIGGRHDDDDDDGAPWKGNI